MFNFGGKNDIIFTQRIPHLETKKTSQRGQSDTRLGRMKAERIKWQMRTRFGKAVVKLFSICYYRNIPQCTHQTSSEIGLVLWVSKH